MTPTPAAQPEAVVPEVLEKCARLLGLELHTDERFGGFKVGNTGIGFVPMSDGDLLLAILNKAAEMGERIDLSFLPNAKVWGMGPTQSPNRIRQYGNTPLEVALLAFAQLERP
jgi:hypothetical protein